MKFGSAVHAFLEKTDCSYRFSSVTMDELMLDGAQQGFHN